MALAVGVRAASLLDWLQGAFGLDAIERPRIHRLSSAADGGHRVRSHGGNWFRVTSMLATVPLAGSGRQNRSGALGPGVGTAHFDGQSRLLCPCGPPVAVPAREVD